MVEAGRLRRLRHLGQGTVLESHKGRKHGSGKKPANFKKIGIFFRQGILLKK
jgi:hypothetical protein